MKSNPQAKGKSKSSRVLQVDPATINKNQLNSSSSKMQYSMPKQSRWKQKKQDSTKFYDIPDTKSNRCASFGYGKKMQMGKSNFKVPSVGAYQIKSQFTGDQRKGITISAGRQVIKNNSVFDNSKNYIPGPGKYSSQGQNIMEMKKGYSISGRSVDLSDKWVRSVPGPGNYQTLELLDKNLKSLNSKYQNVQAGKFGKKERKSDFEQKATLKLPGPGQYKQAGDTEKLAKFAAKGGNKFSHSERQGIIGNGKQKIPGPGSYNFFSEFIH